MKAPTQNSSTNKNIKKKRKPQKKTYTKLSHPLKSPNKNTSCLSIFVSKNRHQQFDPTTTPASFDSLQVFQVSPPFRDPRITPRRDSLSLRWQLPSFATWVELQHDGGFGGNWTHTLAIRWGFGWGWKGQISRKRKMTSGAHFGVEGTKYPNLVPPKQNINILIFFSCLGMWGRTHLIGGNFTYFLEILRPENWGR